MIQIVTKTFLLNKYQIWFPQKPILRNSFKIAVYLRCKKKYFTFAFIREEHFTILININQSEDSIFKQFAPNTRNEIRRAEKEGVIFNLLENNINNINLFVEFYNKFTRLKNLKEIKNDILLNSMKSLIITSATMDNKENIIANPLVMHVYIMDNEEKRAVLMFSASLFRAEEFNDIKHIIGNANRFLHFKDMLYFKSLGLSYYDFGGYAMSKDSQDLKNINFFKKSFGGNIVKEYDYYSFLYFLGKKIMKIF